MATKAKEDWRADWLFRLAARQAAEDLKRADEYDPLFRAVYPAKDETRS